MEESAKIVAEAEMRVSGPKRCCNAALAKRMDDKALIRAIISACFTVANEASTLRNDAKTTTIISIIDMMTNDNTRENPRRFGGLT